MHAAELLCVVWRETTAIICEMKKARKNAELDASSRRSFLDIIYVILHHGTG